MQQDYRDLLAATGADQSPGQQRLPVRRYARPWPTTAPRRIRTRHSVLLDYDVFENVPQLDAKDLTKIAAISMTPRIWISG